MGVKEVIDNVVNRQELYFTKKNLINMIKGCRTNNNGLPILKFTGRGKVICECWRGKGEYPNTTVLSYIPEEDMEFLKLNKPTWKELVEKYGNEKQKEKLL